MDNGVNPRRQVAVGERLSYSEEKIFQGTLEQAARTDFSYLCVMVIY
jgi:cobalt-precorrin-7 (C5)-methyltransferase